MEHFLSRLRKQIQKHPDQLILLDHNGTVQYTYRTLSEQMVNIDALLSSLGIHQGDKVALCGRNSAHWAAAFISLLARRSVAVTILPDFTSEGVCDLVKHAEAKAFFVGPTVWKGLNEYGVTTDNIFEKMPALQVLVALEDFSVLAQSDSRATLERLSSDSQEPHEQPTIAPQNFENWMATWPSETSNELCLINYTSGTTSSPKGVMLSSLSLSANVEQGLGLLKTNPEGKHLVAILPMAHMYGLAVEILAELVCGICVHVLTKVPTPAILVEALNSVKPCVLFCVPLVLEKVFRQKVIPILTKPHMRVLLALPFINKAIKKKVRNTVINAMGGNLEEGFVIGGAAINQEVEKWMHTLELPYIVGYGMTECGPLIAASQAGTFAPYSTGKQLPGMEIRIDSEDPHKVDGEILVKGTNTMLGYYKNDEATAQAFTKDGWLRTGDLGILSPAGDLYIRGRSKNMILGPSGQNIYPEELEDKVNGIPGVAESIVLEREGHLVSLIYADPLFIRRMGMPKYEKLMAQRMKQINSALPKYSQIDSFEFVEHEFEKTPKKSIKRFLYK